MSGICAVFHCNGARAAEADLAPVLAALAVRGPDGSASVCNGPAALGHALLATTPEALIEQQPFTHSQTGCTITADIRLDNRADLLAALGLGYSPRVVGDAELTLLSYLRWGTDCLDRLRGDFAFAIWDPREQRLFCARDQVGMRQLVYHNSSGKLFALATEPAVLLRHHAVPKRVNEARIADFLEGFEAIDLTSTFFLDVFRLPPAHAMIIDQSALRIWRYWRLAPPPIVRRPDQRAYVDAFLDVFTESVRSRLRSPDAVGSMLSGGMDSGSVTAIAAQLLKAAGAAPLKTFSAIDEDPDCKESQAIREALTLPGIDPHLVVLGDTDGYAEDVARLTLECAEPFDGNMALPRAIYLAGQRSGIKVMLDGVSGDTTLPTGNMIAHHLGQGDWIKAWKEARAQERFWGKEFNGAKEFTAVARRRLAPAWFRALRHRRWERLNAEIDAEQSPVNAGLAERIRMPERRRAHADHVRTATGNDPATQALRMLHPYAVVGRERYDRVAGAVGIEPRDPFLDIRVLEFCLTLPVEQIHADGWPKLILRNAMGGILPDPVRWKLGRHHLGWRFSETCDRYINEVDAGRGDCDLSAYTPDDDCDERVPRDMTAVELRKNLLYLAIWLRNFNRISD